MAKTWTGLGGDNLWTTASNWSPSGVPTYGSITVPAGSTIQIPADEGKLDYLYVTGTGTVTFTGAGSIYFNNNISLSNNSTLLLTGGVSVTAGVATYTTSGGTGSQITLNGATLNLYGSSTSTVPIDFVEGPVGNTSYNVLAVRSYSTLGHILNLGYGDVISTGDTGSTLVLVANGDGTYSLNNTHNGHYTSTITSYVTLAAGTVVGDFTTSGGSLLYTGPHTCFCAGTYLATPEGEIAVEDIVPGTRLRTASGEVKPVLWVGRSTIATRFADLERALPVRIKAGALGENLPVRDLVVSPCHGLLIDGVLVNAGAIVNGVTIVREHDVPELFTYFHVEFADHEIVLAEGVATESFIDSGERLLFQNWAERADALGDAAVKTELPYPRVKSARQVPAAVRRQIAGQIGGAETGSLAA
jgi:hypothetical protein